MDDKFFKLELPSKLVPYKTLNVQEVSIRMLKGKDEKLIGELTVVNFEKKFAMLLGDVIRGIHPEELVIADRMFITLWLASNCYSNIYPIEYTCAECLHTNRMDVQLTSLSVSEIDPKYVEPYTVNLKNGDKVKMRLLRVKDQIQYIDYQQQKKKDDILFKLALTMVDDRDILKRTEYLESLSVMDIGLMKAFHENFNFGVKLETTYACPKCGGGGVVPVPFRLDMLSPDGKTIARAANYNF